MVWIKRELSTQSECFWDSLLFFKFKKMNRNFLHVHKYILVGVAIFSTAIFGMTYYVFAQNTTTDTVTASFSVVQSSTIDCAEPLRPKTRTLFTVNPTAGGSFSVLWEGIGAMNTTNFMPGEHLLHNGAYNWKAVVNSGYSGSGSLQGSFSLNATCPSSTTSTTIPTVTTPTATSITSTSATLGANIISDGGAAITGRGTCWGTHTDTITNCAPTESISTGVFTHSRTGMPSGTLIYYRGYATNSVGKAYSTSGSFTTPATVSFSVKPLTTVVCTEPTNPKINVSFETIPLLGGYFVLSSNTNPNRLDIQSGVHALSSGDYSWQGVVNSGYATTPGTAVEGNFSLPIAVCPSLTTSTTIPTVAAPTATSITSTSATLGANIISDGGAAITGRGTCWGTLIDPVTNCAPTESISTGVFTHSRTGMPSGTLIYYRGYATNSVGKAYSTSGSFTTPATTAVTPIPAAFSVVPSSTIDCAEPLRPKTKTTFIVDPTAGGSFSISWNGITSSTNVMPGTHMLPNGSYTWRAVVNSGYSGSGSLQGSFSLNATCSSSLSTVASTSTSTTTTNTLATVPTSVSFSVVPTKIVNCLEPLFPKTKTYLNISHPDGGVFSLSRDNGASYTQMSHGERMLHNGSYLWKAVIKTLYVAALPSSGTFVLNSTCETPSSYVAPSTVTTQIQNESTTTIHNEVVTPVSQAEKIEILARVDSPASCMTPTECAVYCSQSGTVGVGRCANFVRASFITNTLKAVAPSFVDGVSLDSVQAILDDATRRPAEIPDAVQSSSDFRSFCSNLDNKEACLTLLTNNNLASQSAISASSVRVEQVYQEQKKVFTERVGARVFVDSDKDGVSDYDEINIYRTNPKAEDTDKDGASDGKEIILRTNPISSEKTAVFANVSQNNPLVSGTLEPKLLVVKDVLVSRIATSTEGVLIAKELTFKGRAIPNSFVTLYIYSEPTVVTVKTNASGEWTYTLDKELPDGEHQIITAITDGGGRVLAKSEPFRFVKVAQAVTVGNIELARPVLSQEPGFFAGTALYIFIAIMIGIAGLGVLIIGFMTKKRFEDDGTAV